MKDTILVSNETPTTFEDQQKQKHDPKKKAHEPPEGHDIPFSKAIGFASGDGLPKGRRCSCKAEVPPGTESIWFN